MAVPQLMEDQVSKSRRLRIPAALTATAALVVALFVPSAAHAQPVSAPDVERTTYTYSMQVDCSTFSEADRERAIRENISLCGVNEQASEGVTTFGQTTADCGTSAVYVDSVNGAARISYGMHSTVGPMVLRDLYVNYGPAVAGEKHDFGALGSPDYSNYFTITGVKGKKMGATLSGSVLIAGWTFSCWVYASEPQRTI